MFKGTVEIYPGKLQKYIKDLESGYYGKPLTEKDKQELSVLKRAILLALRTDGILKLEVEYAARLTEMV